MLTHEGFLISEYTVVWGPRWYHCLFCLFPVNYKDPAGLDGTSWLDLAEKDKKDNKNTAKDKKDEKDKEFIQNCF